MDPLVITVEVLGPTAVLYIEHQEFLCGDFNPGVESCLSPGEPRISEFIASNGIRLVSDCEPVWDEEVIPEYPSLYLLGRDEQSTLGGANRTAHVPVDKVPGILQAVQEYNQHRLPPSKLTEF